MGSRTWLVLAAALAGCGRVAFDDVPDAGPTGTGCVASFTAFGDQACAVRTDGSLYCWGANGHGQLGDGSFADRALPGPALIDGVATVASGETTVCAVRTDGTLWCWGENDLGQVGDGAMVDRAVPRAIALPAPIAEVHGGEYHTCARATDTTGWCWGDNASGELGYPTPIQQLLPQPSPIGDVAAFTLGDQLTCALRTDATVACWGKNTEGELGDGTTVSRPDPAQIAGVSEPVAQVVAGCHRHVCAVTTSGDVWCWGENMDGQLGRGTSTAFEDIPVRVAGLPPVAQVAVGAFHTCVRTTAGEVWCWGSNDTGELGDGSFTGTPTPHPVTALPGTPIDVQASCTTTHVLFDDRTMAGWGGPQQLGTGATTPQPRPVAVPVPCPG